MTFPLIPRGRVIGLSFGTMRSSRRGKGSYVVGSRPYQVGDDVHAIDWAASARLSAARSSDEFVVREHYADEAPRVVIVCDRRPAMAHHERPLPWLDKAAAMRVAAELVLDSAARVGGLVGYLDHGDGRPYWVAPRGERRLAELREERLGSHAFSAPADSVEAALDHLSEHRRAVTSGSFVFLLSDFLPPLREGLWDEVAEQGWDVVPVVIQDPVWDTSFPDVHGLVLPLRDAETGRRVNVRLRRREVEARRRANEERAAALRSSLAAAGLDAVHVSSHEPADVQGSFLAWAELRRLRRAA